MNLRTTAVILIAMGVGFWGIGLVSALLGNLTTSNVWYAVSAISSIAGAAVALFAVGSSRSK